MTNRSLAERIKAALVAPLLFVVLAELGGAGPATAQQAPAAIDPAPGAVQVVGDDGFRAIRTDSPRQTWETLLYLAGELDAVATTNGLDLASDDRATYRRILLLLEQARALIDLSQVPPSTREEVGTYTTAYLFDILGRIDLPDTASIPAAAGTGSPELWRVPGTPLRIVRVLDGPQRGEFLFDADTHRDAPRFFRGIESVPLRSAANVESWTSSIPQLTGPLIPSTVVRAIPKPLRALWLGTPIWKILVVFSAAFALGASVLVARRTWRPTSDASRAQAAVRRGITPLVSMLIALGSRPFVAYQLNVYGAFWTMLSIALTIVVHVSAALVFWWFVIAVVERMLDTQGEEESIRNPILLIGGKTVALIGAVTIWAVGAQDIGLPVYSVAAGLGIGGLAVALSIRPTLENLIGGVILYLDQPVREGDFCSFGDKFGTVERIGARSTKVRGRDRTLMSIPNADFVDKELVNWAHCDKMLIQTTATLRHETSPDQLRHILVKMRELSHAHPMIENDTVRIRLAGIGPSSLEVSIRIYALTTDWNEFFAVQEDIFLRMKDIVADSGTGFAAPSQILHLAKDRGIDDAGAHAAVAEVEKWRGSGKLPFPRLSERRRQEIEDSLDWPPHGSEAIREPHREADERLSAKRPEDVSDDPR